MRCRLIRPMTCRPSKQFPAKWQCSQCAAEGEGPKLLACPKCGRPVRQKSAVKPAGTEIDHPQAYRLVQMGVAEALDAECERRANRTPEQLAVAAYAYERANRGIHPEDFEAYDAGDMIGYAPDGSPIPGPAAPCEDEEDAGED